MLEVSAEVSLRDAGQFSRSNSPASSPDPHMSPRGDIYRPLRESKLNPDRPAQFPACHSQQSGVSVCNPSIAQLSVWTHARAGTGSDPIHRLHYDTDVRRCAEDHEMRARFGVFFFFRDLVIGDGLLDPRLDRAGKIIPAAFSKSNRREM